MSLFTPSCNSVIENAPAATGMSHAPSATLIGSCGSEASPCSVGKSTLMPSGLNSVQIEILMISS